LGALAAAGTLVGVGLLLLIMLMVEARPAEATFPGQNGKIAYTLDPGDDEKFDIYTINPDGGGSRVQVTNNTTRHESHPSYSPDGKKIVYYAFDGNDLEPYTINVGGGGRRGVLPQNKPVQLTNNTRDDFEPSWGKSVDLIKPCPPAQQQ
jgi:Tol biopolymer transport system component